MNYCSLEDAFNMAPGCNQTDSSAREARREERRRAKKCKGPALTYLESKDPDRQSLERPKDIPPMSSASTGLKGHVPADAPLGMEPFQDVNVIGSRSDGDIQEEILRQNLASYFPRTDDDPAGDRQRSTLPTPAMLAQALPSKSPAKKSFFGADPGDDSFADYMPDAKNYLMEPSFTTAFKSLNPGTLSKSVLPVPSVRDVWKPLTPTGIDTAFFKKLPPPGGEYTPSDGYPYAPAPGEANRGGNADDYMSYKTMYRKMDAILSRLDELQRGPNPEQSQKEILLFVSSGIFVLFMMDLLVRKGSSLRFLRGL
jgi:hypothetical protein